MNFYKKIGLCTFLTLCALSFGISNSNATIDHKGLHHYSDYGSENDYQYKKNTKHSKHKKHKYDCNSDCNKNNNHYKKDKYKDHYKCQKRSVFGFGADFGMGASSSTVTVDPLTLAQFTPEPASAFDSYTFTTKHNYAYSGYIDYNYLIKKNMTLGLEFGYHQIRHDSNDEGMTFIESDILSAMVNVHYCFKFTSMIEPYLMAGAGIARTSHKGIFDNYKQAIALGFPDPHFNLNFNNINDIQVAYQFGLGVATNINNVRLGMGYKFFGLKGSNNLGTENASVIFPGGAVEGGLPPTLTNPGDLHITGMSNNIQTITFFVRAAV